MSVVLYLRNYNDIKEGDQVEAYKMVETAEKISLSDEKGAFMRKNSIKNTRVNAEVQRELSIYSAERNQRSASGAYDFRSRRGSGSGSENL